MTPRQLLAALVPLLLLPPACVRPDTAQRYVPAWEPFDATAPGWETGGKSLLISDCQLHNLLSQALPERNLSIESAAATAIRPPQLDLFAADVLGYIVRRHARDVDLIIHLGDALDLGCEAELDAFLRVMDGAGKPWVMAPGNHDFFYFGSYDPDDDGLWSAACNRAGPRLRKGDFIRRYVEALHGQPAFAELAQALDAAAPGAADPKALAAALPADFDWQAPPGSPSRMARICWHIVEDEPWRSFLLQLVDVAPAHGTLRSLVLLLDSCQYGHRPALIPNAWSCFPVALNCGFTGEMLPDQLRKARQWVEEVGERATGGIAMMCHHPFASLAPRTKSSLGWLWREHRIGLLVTAHTHHGYFASHDLGAPDEELELNLGSTTDWPMEWRTLQAFVNAQQQQIYLRSERHTLVDALRQDGGCFQPGWEVPYGAADDYRRYRQGRSASGLLIDYYLAFHLVPNWLPPPTVRANAAARETEEQVKETLLWTYLRLIQTFPTDTGRAPAWPDGCADDLAVLCRIHALAAAGKIDAQTGLLEQLERFERTRHTRDRDGTPTDDERARFKLSQAAWAARFESAQGRRLQVEDELIRVDWEKSLRKQARIDHGAAGSGH